MNDIYSILDSQMKYLGFYSTEAMAYVDFHAFLVVIDEL